MVNKVTFHFVWALLRAIMAHATNIIEIASPVHTRTAQQPLPRDIGIMS